MIQPRLTALGVKALLFHLLLCLAFAAAPYANLFFLLLAFLTVLGFMELFWSAANLRRVEVDAIPSAPFDAGSVQELGAVFRARRPATSVALRLEFEGLDDVWIRAPAVDGDLPATASVGPLSRGIHPLRRATLTSRWPLGLFAWQRPIAIEDRLLVLPAPLDPDSCRPLSRGDLESALQSRVRYHGMAQPAGVREFRAGDELRGVHWRASARRGALVVQEWDEGHDEGLELVLDRRVPGPVLERRLSVLAGFAALARQERKALTLHTQELSARFGAEREGWDVLHEFLAATQPLPATAGPPSTAPASALPIVLANERSPPGALR